MSQQCVSSALLACVRASGEKEGSMRSWNAGVHRYEVMGIMGCLHRGKARCETKIKKQGGEKIHGQERQFTIAAAAHHIYQAHRQALSLRKTNTSTPPPKKLLTLYMYRTLIPCLRVGSWAGWLVRVWSLTRSNKDEENKLIVNWMWSGLLLSDNATYCTAAAVEPHHQHIAPWPLLFPPLLCPCKTLPPSEMLLSGHQRSKQWASAIKALILFSHQYQTCNLL